MSIAKVTNDRYTVDSLYQWDQKQTLSIYGLSLPSTPEIHFSNSAMDTAIVVQASTDVAGVVTVDIPQVFLETSGNIDVYVCIYEGESFRCLYKLVVPVKARRKPSDYVYTEDEILTYKTLEKRLSDLEQTGNSAGGMSNEAVNLLLTILSDATFNSDQTENIQKLKEILSVGTEEPDVPDKPDPPVIPKLTTPVIRLEEIFIIGDTVWGIDDVDVIRSLYPAPYNGDWVKVLDENGNPTTNANGETLWTIEEVKTGRLVARVELEGDVPSVTTFPVKITLPNGYSNTVRPTKQYPETTMIKLPMGEYHVEEQTDNLQREGYELETKYTVHITGEEPFESQHVTLTKEKPEATVIVTNIYTKIN